MGTIQCNRCVMDDSTVEFKLNSDGTCNFCSNFEKDVLNAANNFKSKSKLDELLARIKEDGKGKEYDCVVGVSGGVDSSYLLTKILKFGLKPIVVHMDNGWDSELAQHNISNLITKLNVDYKCYVIYWPEYRSLMQAFFQSNVVDVELLYDNAMLAVNYKIAEKFKIKYIIGGTNNSTEGFRLPRDWSWHKYDKINIKSIHKKFNHEKNNRTRTYPYFGWVDYFRCRFVKRIKWISLLDFIDFNKDQAIIDLKSEINYKPYPYKHYESVFTRFYQGYLLPKKFNIDKRKIHFSNLILTNQLTRINALKELQKSPYPSEIELQKDMNFFLKKMKWSKADLEKYLSEAPISHEKYSNSAQYTDKLIRFKRKLLDF